MSTRVLAIMGGSFSALLSMLVCSPGGSAVRSQCCHLWSGRPGLKVGTPYPGHSSLIGCCWGFHSGIPSWWVNNGFLVRQMSSLLSATFHCQLIQTNLWIQMNGITRVQAKHKKNNRKRTYMEAIQGIRSYNLAGCSFTQNFIIKTNDFYTKKISWPISDPSQILDITLIPTSLQLR